MSAAMSNRDLAIRHGDGTTRAALVVAINYTGTGMDLRGCEHDGLRMRDFFMSRGYDVTTMSASSAALNRDGTLQPTKTNILRRIHAIGATPALRKFALFFAGHGAQVPDLNGDEDDGMDEALVCQSPLGPHVRPGRPDFLLDDELLSCLRRALPAPADAHVFVDACHSGTVCDLGAVLRGERWEGRPAAEGPGILCVSAARDEERAMETASGGVMTTALLGAARMGRVTLRDLLGAFRNIGGQSPQITCTGHPGLDTSLCEGDLRAPPDPGNPTNPIGAAPLRTPPGTRARATGATRHRGVAPGAPSMSLYLSLLRAAAGIT